MKSEKMIDETNFEHQAHQAELKIRKLTQEGVQAKNKAESQHSLLSNQAKLIENLKSELMAKESMIRSSKEVDQASQLNIQTFEDEKRSLTNLMLKKQEDIDSLTRKMF